jgi:hypothetical protein
MGKIIYISSEDTAGIKSINELANDSGVIEHLGSIDYYFILFSTLYQSGCSFFQLDTNQLPDSVTGNPFWKGKIIHRNDKAYLDCWAKANNILISNFNFEKDQKYISPL